MKVAAAVMASPARMTIAKKKVAKKVKNMISIKGRSFSSAMGKHLGVDSPPDPSNSDDNKSQDMSDENDIDGSGSNDGQQIVE